jgi:hypothetical protein
MAGKFTGKDSLNETLYKVAEKAVEDLFNDDSVPKEKARENLRGIIESTKVLLESLGDDEEND